MRTVALSVILSSFVLGSAHAEEVFTVMDADGSVIEAFEMSDLDALKQTSYVTDNAFLDEPAEFSGPLVREVLSALGADTSEIEAVRFTALNDYEVSVPVSDIVDFDVILATRLNGSEMSVRERGPIWIMYPISDNEELKDSIYSSRLIWQLKSLQIEK